MQALFVGAQLAKGNMIQQQQTYIYIHASLIALLDWSIDSMIVSSRSLQSSPMQEEERHPHAGGA